jgi:cyclic pyranopterin phosphate synthase
MVDVGAKPVTAREAVARARVFMAGSTVRALRANAGPKGDPIEVARLAGIMAAKRTADLIPLCHPLPLTHVDVQIQRRRDGFDIEAVARTSAQTGVEMEALTAATVAALTVYDMAKALDKSMIIGDVQLLAKRGGKSGEWIRSRKRKAGIGKRK